MALLAWATPVLTIFVGLLLPIWGTFTAIESRDKADDTQWLMYWVIFALGVIINTLAFPVLSWIPLMPQLRLLLLSWLALPQYKGASWVYHALLRPVVAAVKDQARESQVLQNLRAHWQSQPSARQVAHDATAMMAHTAGDLGLNRTAKELQAGSDQELSDRRPAGVSAHRDHLPPALEGEHDVSDLPQLTTDYPSTVPPYKSE